MFFILSKILAFALDPVVWILALLLWAWKRRSTWPIFTAGLLLFLLSIPALLETAMRRWETPAVSKDALPLIRTAVVLGGATEGHKVPSDQMHFNAAADRYTEALALYHQGMVTHLMLSGGSGALFSNGERLESELAAEFLVLCGVQPSALTVESASRDTRENAAEVARLLSDKGIADQPVLLITSAYHMPRAVACFQKQGLEVIPYSVDIFSGPKGFDPGGLVPDANTLAGWKILIKEWAGYLMYRVAGFA